MSQAAETVKSQLFPPVPQPVTDEAAMRRSVQAVSSLTTYADGKGVGLKNAQQHGLWSRGAGSRQKRTGM